MDHLRRIASTQRNALDLTPTVDLSTNLSANTDRFSLRYPFIQRLVVGRFPEREPEGGSLKGAYFKMVGRLDAMESLANNFSDALKRTRNPILARYLRPPPQRKTSKRNLPLAALDSRHRLPRPIHPRYTTCANRRLLGHGKPAADFQQPDGGIGDIPHRP